jgi:hypothetical protein
VKVNPEKESAMLLQEQGYAEVWHTKVRDVQELIHSSYAVDLKRL